MSKKEKSRSYAIVGVIAAMVLIISIAAIVMIKYHSYKANKQYEDLQNQMTANVTAVPEAVSEETTEETETVVTSITEDPAEVRWNDQFIRTPDKEVNFNELQAINPDVYAWISIPGTEIDYPVAHCDKDHAIYLEEDINNQKSAY